MGWPGMLGLPTLAMAHRPAAAAAIGLRAALPAATTQSARLRAAVAITGRPLLLPAAAATTGRPRLQAAVGAAAIIGLRAALPAATIR